MEHIGIYEESVAPVFMPWPVQNSETILQQPWTTVSGYPQLASDDNRVNDRVQSNTSSALGGFDGSTRPEEVIRMPTETTCCSDIPRVDETSPENEVGHKSSDKKKRRTTDKNRRPCAYCQSLQKKCVVIREAPRLCQRCANKSYKECPPHETRKTNVEKIPTLGLSAPYSGMGVFKLSD
ncbi:uncharacterized protein FOMMEDRAFT_139426 [Fomitiporia mediterranea MF3/22]|uniref:uncharacterized protein n=1 Tax=Fomitiporia mediterranea (strain MF3/22) TaxID=694068 RepID=UPI00044084C4|nr:uncharacterized protein FOMMEDRAFT_139426 [Fomitiporia mediterranea MF3/22]EJD06212.1 hypothetical protein FOMMEDRAFT_139426 [Fomitiporia mediterranea MF3/22]